MYLIRDVMHCKPGQVRPMVEKFKAVGKAMKKAGFKNDYRILTDVCAEQYWTIVWELSIDSLDFFENMPEKMMNDKAMAKAMEGYHDLVDSGRREIFKVE